MMWDSMLGSRSAGRRGAKQNGVLDSSMSQMDSEDPLDSRRMPSSKVQTLADDIAELEDRCQYLESRNGWLTKQLLNSQRRFIQKTVMGSQRVQLQTCFQACNDALHDMTLEKQLEEQTYSLDKCQQVARDLGSALAQEQDFRKQTEMASQSVQEDLQRAIAHESNLRQSYKGNQITIELLEKRIQEAESTLFKGRSDAQVVVDASAAYDHKRRVVEEEMKRAKIVKKEPTSLEQSIQLREQAHGVMREVQGILQQGRPQAPETMP